MTLDSTHPDYDKMANDYRQMRDTSSGQRAVKMGGTLYLKPTAGMTLDGAKLGIEPGYSAYLTYPCGSANLRQNRAFARR